MTNKKVFIGVGHGGSDPGAVKYLKEKDVNLVMAKACRDYLVKNGVNVKMSREKDEHDTLSEEIKECNAYAPDVAVDIHNNAGGGDGAEAYHHYGGGTGKTLALNILKEIYAIGQNVHSNTPKDYSSGAKIRKNEAGTDYYGFIRETAVPAVIIECCFVDNAADYKIADTVEEQQRFGVAIARGILATLGITPKETTTKEETVTEKLYRVQVGAYANKSNAEAMQKKLNAAGFEAIIV